MDIPHGYKKTELGVIPEDWVICSINQLVDNNIIEKPLDGNHGNIHPKGKDYVSYGIPFIMANSIHDGILDLNNCHFIKKEQADNLQKGFSLAGDVLLTHKGTVGNVTIVGKIFTPYIMLTPQVTYYRVKDSNKITNLFIRYFFESRKFQTILQNFSGGGTRSYIGITKQKELPFVLPPLAEQKAIAQSLSDVDALITAIDQLITKKRNIKQGTMQQLLTGKKRLPGFGEGYSYKQTEIGEIPEDWNIVSYRDNLSIISGLGFKKAEYKNHGVKLLRIDNVSYGSIKWESIAHLPQDYAEKHKDLVIEENDILLALNRPITNGKLKIAIAKNTDIPAILYQRVGKIIFLNQTYNKKYAFYLLSKFIKKFVEESAVGTDQPFISTTNLKKYKIPLPPPEEQKAIAQILTDMDAEIEGLEKKLEKHKTLKQGMMQELLTGKTRLKYN
ncbi:restriction endonuclease subunit S [Nodularia sp. UHCC 0506]|uniref:restriction endonuclease subunit S n=1 Tax=Nodularia sp. UHCC 0506 TaxID=3110243 RepID=UPI002B1F2786|nr:restriction endonuclease subunit S [Nodularia sp. UHCC 0506]MEA5517258.1 restriction endonuclease subunit S [Nodularia sp. UHCC 0506]